MPRNLRDRCASAARNLQPRTITKESVRSMSKHLRSNRLSHLAHGETLPTPRQGVHEIVAAAQRLGLVWGKLLNSFHDEGRVFHALLNNGAPRCGASYFTSTGEYPGGPQISQCCRRCLQIVRNRGLKARARKRIVSKMQDFFTQNRK